MNSSNYLEQENIFKFNLLNVFLSVTIIGVLSLGLPIAKRNICSKLVLHSFYDFPTEVDSSCLEKLPPESLSNLVPGYILFKIGFDQDYPLLKTFLEQNPTHPIAHLALGTYFWQLHDKVSAVEIWNNTPNIYMYFVNQSIVEAGNRKLTQAQELIEIASILAPGRETDKAQAYGQLCREFKKEKDFEKSLNWCKKFASSLENGWAQIELADNFYKLAQYSDARDALEWAAEVGFLDARKQVYQKLGDIYFSMGELDNSITAYKYAVSLGQNNEWVYLGLANAWLGKGDQEKACSMFAQAIQKKPSLFYDKPQLTKICSPSRTPYP